MVAPGFSWRTLPSLTKKRQGAMGVAVGDTMYVLGGIDETGPLDSVERLDPAQAAWTAGPSLPSPQCCAAVGALGNVIAVAGGYGSDGQTPTNALVLLDTTTGVWTSGPPMPTARVNAMGAVWNGKLAVIGGSTAFGSMAPIGVIEIYDPAANAWTTSTLAVTPRAGGVAVVDGDRIYVIGGAGQGSLYGDPTVEIVTASGVTAGPSLLLGRVQVAGGLLPSGPVVAGGWTPQYDTAEAEGLLGARTGWQLMPAMPTHRSGAAAAVVGGSLIVAGGGQFLHAAWVYQDAVEALAAD
jgi:N-acetylneuraminic acid mutarotase